MRLVSAFGLPGLLVLAASCRLFGAALPCDEDAECPPEQRCGGDGLCSAPPGGEGEGEGEGEALTGNCSALRLADPSRGSGTVVLNGVPTLCDMETDGGGWTLFARSAPSGTGGLTWLTPTGDVDDLVRPYVYGGDPGRIDEVLVASLDDTGRPGADAYVVRFDGDPRQSVGQVRRSGAVKVLASSCEVDASKGQPFMLGRAGCNAAGTLSFRDNEGCVDFAGLFGDGWRLNGTPPDDVSDCAGTGNLDGKQGLIMVRSRRRCADATATGPTVVDGIDGAVEAFCDADTDGGGWTLIGRSVDGGVVGAGEGFGWGARTGTLDDLTGPYAIDALAARVRAREILVAEATATLAPGPRRFRMTFADDVTDPAFARALIQSTTQAAVGSECLADPLQGGFMYEHAGCTDRDTGFFLVDNGATSCDAGFGVNADGVVVGDLCCGLTECQRTGELRGRQAMIFAR